METPKPSLVDKKAIFGVYNLSETKQYNVYHGGKGDGVFCIIRTCSQLEIVIENTTYTVDAQKLVFVGPSYQLKIPMLIGRKGYLFYFNAEFYEKSIADMQILNSALFFGKYPLVQIDDRWRNSSIFKQQIIDRLGEYQTHKKIAQLFAHHCIESFMLDGYEYMDDKIQKLCIKECSARLLVNRFTVLVHQHYRNHTTVQFYASKLYITARKLTQTCLAISAKSAKCIICDIITKEALRYIRNTDLSISQISYEMGFTDESNFRNFVKRQTGSTPRAYRNL